MARRSELKGVASGIIGSFSSRNNNVDGYWGIGKIFGFANTKNTDLVSIELLSGTIKPQTDNFQSLVIFYRAMLQSQLMGKGIPIKRVSQVKITARFNQNYQERYHYWRSALGKPYICECEIIDDNGKVYKAIAGNNCWSHDPTKKHRRSQV